MATRSMSMPKATDPSKIRNIIRKNLKKVQPDQKGKESGSYDRGKAIQELQHALKLWEEHCPSNHDPALVHVFTDQFSVCTNTAWENADRNNRVVAKYLVDACKGINFYVCFAEMRREEDGDDITSTLRKFSEPEETPEGAHLFQKFSVDISDDNLVDVNHFENEEHDYETRKNPHFMEDTDYLHRRWKRHVVLFMPRSERMSFFLEGIMFRKKLRISFVEGILEGFESELASGSITTETKENMAQICELFESKSYQAIYPTSLIPRIVAASANLAKLKEPNHPRVGARGSEAVAPRASARAAIREHDFALTVQLMESMGDDSSELEFMDDDSELESMDDDSESESTEDDSESDT